MSWLAVGAAAAPIVGGLVGNLMGQGDRNKAKAAMKQAMAELEAVGYPPDLSKEIIFKQFEQVGILTPELEEDLQLAQSEFSMIKEDANLRNTQLEALNKFKQQATGGIAGDERAAMNEILQKQRQEQQAAQQNILADAQRRGQSGGGNSLIAQLQATQSAAGQASNQGMDLMSLLAQRVRQGTQDMSGAAQNVRTQDYNVASDKANAIDARNQFLYNNSMARQNRNVDRNNNAQSDNLQNEQRVQDANTNLANNESLRQNQAQRDYYTDKLSLATAKANAATGQANYYQGQAQNTANMGAQIGAGVGQGVAGYAQGQQSQANADRDYNLKLQQSGLTAGQVEGRAAEDSYKFPVKKK